MRTAAALLVYAACAARPAAPPKHASPVRTTCSAMGAPARTPALVGARYGNAASALPAGLRMESESAIGDSRYSVVTAMRGTTLAILLSRDLGGSSPEYEIEDALEISAPCTDLVLEARTCDFDGTHDPGVIALMDATYQCGGHGESTPARAWRVRGGRLVDLEPTRVTCGSQSCEIDR